MMPEQNARYKMMRVHSFRFDGGHAVAYKKPRGDAPPRDSQSSAVPTSMRTFIVVSLCESMYLYASR